MSLPSRWLVLRVRFLGPEDAVGEGPVALLAEALTDVGGRAVQEQEDGWCLTHLPADDGARPPSGDAEEWRTRLASVLDCDPLGLQVETAWQDHGDWAELWKRGLEPRRVTRRIVVTPSWCAPDLRPGDLVITVDPGMAFGNAEHGTTRGCLRLMDGRVRSGDHILDVGAGSAILSIAAALLGAERVHAVEMDELAVPTALENVAENGVADRVSVEQRRMDAADIAARGLHDGVIANIEAGYLKPLLPGLIAATAPGAWLLLSGILDGEAVEMRRLTEAVGATWVGTDSDGEWCSMLFRRR